MQQEAARILHLCLLRVLGFIWLYARKAGGKTAGSLQELQILQCNLCVGYEMERTGKQDHGRATMGQTEALSRY